MKTFILACLALASFAYAEESLYGNTAYGYLKNVGIPEAERIKAAEEKSLASRIVGGVPAGQGQYPYQAGLLLSITGIEGNGVCGGSLISKNRVLTAAHCWNDGVNQVWMVTVVLGTNTLFSGGKTLKSTVTVMHPNWRPAIIRNDIAVIHLPNDVQLSSKIGPIALASESSGSYVGTPAIASGFGLTSSGGSISVNQTLSHVRLNVIRNSLCSLAFPFIIRSSNLCTSGVGGVGACNGDSGGPLVAIENGQKVLIGVTSFGSGLGCQINLPTVFTRVSSFISFINENL